MTTMSRCGQRQLAAAALHTLDGTPVHSLALHSLHGDSSRTAESALVRRFFHVVYVFVCLCFTLGAWVDFFPTSFYFFS